MEQIKKLGMLFLASNVMCIPAMAQKTASEKPNFLIIMTDQQKWDALHAAGNQEIHTPNLDRLAAEGVYFSQAICPVPVSGPSRTCMLTGHLLENTHVYTNTDSDTLQTCRYRSYDQILVERGYSAECYGKFHSPEQMADCYTNPPKYGLAGTRLIKEWEQVYRHHLLDSANTKFQHVREGELVDFSFYGGQKYIPNPIDLRYENVSKGGIIPKEGKCRLPTQPDHHGTLLVDDNHTITAFQAQEAIEALHRLKDEQFVLTCSFHSPHSPMLSNTTYLKLYDVDKLSVPVSLKDDMAHNPYKTTNKRLLLPEYSDPGKIRYMIADYYALISEVDFWVGKILDTLEELGLSDNTVVFFLSDHGEMLGAHGMREKNNFLEESVRVPLIIRDPHLAAGHRTVNYPVSCRNIFQTIMDYAGVEDVQSDGYSLRPVMLGGKPEDDFVVSEWDRHGFAVPNLMVRTADWKLILNTKDKSGAHDALFDLKNDPYEMTNLLYSDPSRANRKICRNLMKQLIPYMAERDYPYMDELKEKEAFFK